MAYNVTDTWFSLDVGPLRLEDRDVPVEGADTDAELVRQGPAADGTMMTAKDLHEAEETFGACHG